MKYICNSICLCGFLLVCLSAAAHARSLSIGVHNREDADPMIALPSSGQQQPYLQQTPQQEVHYVSIQPQSGQEHPSSEGPQQQETMIAYQPVSANEDHRPQEPQQQQQQVFQKEYEQYQLMQLVEHPVASHEYNGPELQQPTNVQIELNSAAPGEKEPVASGEYPGEIVYVGSNAQTGDQNSLAGVANSLQQSSGLAATILTEVPVKDMPYEVLEKLRREYGVKVVATRERPGANLVINCEEHSTNRDSSVCSKQARYTQIVPEQQDYHTLEPSMQEHREPIQYQYQHQPSHLEVLERPEVGSRVIQVSHEPSAAQGVMGQHQPHVRVFSHRGVMEQEVEQPAYQPPGGDEQRTGPEGNSAPTVMSEHQQQTAGEASEYYGSKATTVVASDQPASLDEASPRSDGEQASQDRQTTANNQEDSGFDEQPGQLEGEQNSYETLSKRRS